MDGAAGLGPEIERRTIDKFQFHENLPGVLARLVSGDCSMQTDQGFKNNVDFRKHTLETFRNEW
jgi:hypothetical protein